MSGFRIEMELGGLTAYLGQLEEACEAAVRPAAQAGAQILYDQVKTNVNALGKKTGSLAASIYQAYSQSNSGPLRAEYHVSWRRPKKREPGARQDKTMVGGLAVAPHGHLVEYGHVQRYVTYIDKRGQWKTLVRPEMRGKPRPKADAPLSVKDAYYVPLKGGPRIVGAKSFIRNARTPAHIRRAQDAMAARWWQELEQRGLL